ncbi:PrgH/EprH family type III secretion apparatus protein [Yersinia hibernica]|uniref:PrgH/EprH family type III secretion apparatus protein n=2 Tax=Yersinia TaxID=629 RepID=A0A7U4GDX1_YEREN|nr:PrgH/EprH family type III secretion apparatus protein [Yersinia hibernica]OVZ78293.1 type III secretion system protein [Yersinia kristensenii]
MNSDMNKITDEMPAPEAQKKFTLKVLFGPMFGCELHLPADDYFLIINPGLALQDTSAASISAGDHAVTYTQNTLYLPCDMPSPNIILRLSAPFEDEESTGGYRLEVQGVDKSYPALLNENEIFLHEHIRFAIKCSEDEWPEDIKNFNLPPLFDAEFIKQEKLEEFNTKKSHTLIIGSIALLLLLLAAAVIWYKKLDNDQQVLTLNEVLAGAPMPLEIVRGHDNNLIYVLATKYQAMEWAQEAIFKLQEKNSNNSVILVWLSQQKNEAISQLAKAGYPVLQIDYSKPQYPTIALYRGLTPQEEEQFKSVALQKIPFALDIKTLVKTKAQLLQEARQGLDRLHIYYRQINTSNGYALVVRDALSDTTLRALQYFIKEFNHQWGTRVINFSINLDENWLQDKSYLDSSNGYLFLNPRHWYFPLKKEI